MDEYSSYTVYNKVISFHVGGSKMNDAQWERILVLQGTAGQAILLGKYEQQCWQFKKEQDPLLKAEHPVVVKSFHDALLLLGQSWSFLSPVYVHPHFKSELWKEVKQTRSLTQLTSWRKACI